MSSLGRVGTGAILGVLVLACDKGREGEAAVATATAASPSSSAVTAAASAPSIASALPTTTTTVLETVIAQHLLVAYRGAKRAPKGVTRTKAQARARAEEALAKVKAGTPFEDAVAAYSDDQGSAERLGSVGKFHRADMDPAFSSAAFGLGVGSVSDVVETPFGFHVIKRTQ